MTTKKKSEQKKKQEYRATGTYQGIADSKSDLDADVIRANRATKHILVRLPSRYKRITPKTPKLR